jgi:flagellar protein FlaG
MLGAINRADGTSRDWNQATNLQNVNSQEKKTLDPKNKGADAELAGMIGNSEDKNKDKLLKELEKLNDQMKLEDKAFRFKYSEKAEKFYVQIVDIRSQEVIDSIPPEYILDLSAKLKELIGLFVDKKL